MRKLLILLPGLIFALLSYGQTQPAVVDSFKRQIKEAVTIEKKIELTGFLSKVLMNVNPAEAEKYGLEMIEMAETTRDRRLMIVALLSNGERYSFLAGRKDNIEKATSYYDQALEIAKQNKLDSQIVRTCLLLSELSRNIPDNNKALDYCNQANSYSVMLKSDSITARVHLEYGSVYLAKNDKLLALRNFFAAVRIAEDLKNYNLLRGAYNKLSVFYAVIEDFDKAIDYQVKALSLIGKVKSGQSPYQKVQELNRVGDLYAYKKNYSMANFYYEKSLALADSLHFEPLKAMSYKSIVNNYMAAEQPQQALDYFNAHPQLQDFLRQVNFGYFVDQSYGYIYTRLGKYDSARYFYNKIASFFENDVNTSNQFSYYYQLGMLHKKTGEIDKSLSYFLKAKELADKMGSLEQMSYMAEMLDTMYQQKGDYKQALLFGSLNMKYKDSLTKLGKEKDLMQVEATDEQQRLERLRKEQEELKRRKNNIQYMGIILGIILLFIVLAILGMFKVSAGLIKAIGFFVFLMLFEFIFLVFKKNIYSITHGEPLKDLAFMIALAALLVPLHHWLEHKVLHYLTSHNRLTAAGQQIRTKFLNRTKKPDA